MLKFVSTFQIFLTYDIPHNLVWYQKLTIAYYVIYFEATLDNNASKILLRIFIQ